jgi:cobalt-zinc-cadmium efflux system outer membrane protein
MGQEIPKLNLSKSYTLEELLTFTLEHNPEVLAAKAEIDMARGELITAGLLPNPKIEFTGRNQRIPEADLSGFNYDINLSQEIPLGGKIEHRKRVAQLKLEKAQLDFQNVVRLKTAEVKKAFYAVLFNQRRQELIKEILEVNKTILDIANKRYKAGDIPLMGVNLASIELQRTTTESLNLQNELNQSNFELLLALGISRDSGEPSELASLKVQGTLSREQIQFNLPELIRFALANRPDYKSLQVAVKAAEASISLAKAEGVPNIEVGGAFERELGNERRIGGFVSIPLPLFNRNQGEIAKSLSRRDQANLELAALKNRIEQEVRMGFTKVEAGKKSLDIFQRGLISLVRENLELNRKAFQAGEIEFLEVARAEEDFIRTNTLFLEALYNYNLALIELETVMGSQFTRALKGTEEKK